jgi:hypothetical protein
LLASLLMPALVRAKGSARQVACLSNFRQIGIAFRLYLTEHEDRFPDRRDLKRTLGYHPWAAWPPSDPRGGWAAIVLSNHLGSDAVWNCPGVRVSPLGQAAQVAQHSRAGDDTSVVSYWLWRFDRETDPVPPDNFWGKGIAQAMADLQAANNPQVGRLESLTEVELVVDPYFPQTIPSVPSELKGRAAHSRGRNRLMMDGHTEFLRDPRLR